MMGSKDNGSLCEDYTLVSTTKAPIEIPTNVFSPIWPQTVKLLRRSPPYIFFPCPTACFIKNRQPLNYSINGTFPIVQGRIIGNCSVLPLFVKKKLKKRYPFWKIQIFLKICFSVTENCGTGQGNCTLKVQRSFCEATRYLVLTRGAIDIKRTCAWDRPMFKRLQNAVHDRPNILKDRL